MKKLAGMVSLFTIAAMLSILSVRVTAKDMTWAGYIVDSACATKKAMWTNKSCAVSCVKNKGAAWVFVESSDGKVLKIENQDAVKEDDVATEVNVTGSILDDGALRITKIEMGKM